MLSSNLISLSLLIFFFCVLQGLVLLNEVALGNISRIQHDDSSLTHPPNGFDSVLAEGRTMPNPKDDHKEYLPFPPLSFLPSSCKPLLCVVLTLLHSYSLSESGHPVIIPQGEVYTTNVSSSFYHNEYLVYDQTQVSMRYLIKIQTGEDEEVCPPFHSLLLFLTHDKGLLNQGEVI